MARSIRLSQDEVATAAQLAGVPPALALAIFKQESSSGTNTKTSSKGAVGPFQVMPDTFRRYMPGGDIYDPVDNMHAGLAVLADGLRKSGGDWLGAAQFYYHGAILPPGKQGPTSGAGTPTTLGYSQQVVDKANRFKSELGMPAMAEPEEEVTDVPDMGDEEDIPGFTQAMNTTQPYDTFNPELNAQGSRNYDMDQYIRRLVDEEFSNG